jgi:hypothetical protein
VEDDHFDFVRWQGSSLWNEILSQHQRDFGKAVVIRRQLDKVSKYKSESVRYVRILAPRNNGGRGSSVGTFVLEGKSDC